MYSPGGRGHGLGPRYRRPSTTRAHALGCPGFFARTGTFEHSVSNWFGGSLSDLKALSTLSAVFHLRFLPGDFRIVLSFMSSCLPPTAFPHGGFWDPTRRRVGWVRQEVVYCYTAGMFSLFLFLFFANFQESFAAKSPHSTFLANGHGRLLP